MCWRTPRLCFLLNCVYISAFFYLFYAFFCPLLSFLSFSVLFRLFNSSLPLVILLYPFPPSFILSGFFVLIFCPISLYIPQSFISFPYLFYLLSLICSLYSLLYFLILYILFILCPYSFLYLLYLPALQFNKCICMTSSVLSGFVFPLLTSFTLIPFYVFPL